MMTQEIVSGLDGYLEIRTNGKTVLPLHFLNNGFDLLKRSSVFYAAHLEGNGDLGTIGMYSLHSRIMGANPGSKSRKPKVVSTRYHLLLLPQQKVVAYNRFPEEVSSFMFIPIIGFS